MSILGSVSGTFEINRCIVSGMYVSLCNTLNRVVEGGLDN